MDWPTTIFLLMCLNEDNVLYYINSKHIIPIIIIERGKCPFSVLLHHGLPIQHAVLRIIKNNIMVGRVAVMEYASCVCGFVCFWLSRAQYDIFNIHQNILSQAKTRKNSYKLSK